MDYFIYSKAPHHNKNIKFIDEFSCIREFGHEKYLNIQPTSLKMHYNKGIEICFITKGKYKWKVEDKEYTLLPDNGFITCPWEFHGSDKGVVDLGELWWIVICPEIFKRDDIFKMGEWSGLSKSEEKEIGETLSNNASPVIHKAQELKLLFSQLALEIQNKDFGYRVKVQRLLESILIFMVRMIKNRDYNEEKNIVWLKSLDEQLSKKISKKLTVEELASIFEMGTTSFNEKVKKLTGYSPSSYVIHLRIERAKHLLLSSAMKLTDIALDCGFYSSQHFSGTFKKWTGMSPSAFKKIPLQK